jgi:hypothetical protein
MKDKSAEGIDSGMGDDKYVASCIMGVEFIPASTWVVATKIMQVQVQAQYLAQYYAYHNMEYQENIGPNTIWSTRTAFFCLD